MSVIATSVRLSQAQVFDNSVTTRAVGIAGFTVLIWDHFITFSDEVELIWKGRKSPLIYLFFLNRYFIPLSFIVNIFAYFSHVWDYDTCNRFVVYEGCMTMLGIAISGLMMFLRIRALYYTNPPVYAIVFVIWSAFIAVNSWLLTHAEPVFMHAPTVISCTMVFSPSLSSIASSSAWLPLLYDTTVVSLTLFKALHRPRGAGGIARELAREGLMYYAVIFAVTLVLAVMIAATDVSIKNITAQLELCLTATMMSRITLELKRFARSASQDEAHRAPLRSDGGQCGVSRASRSEGGGGGGGGGGGDRLPRAHVSTSHYSASRARDVGIDTSFFALVTRESSVGGVSGGDLERGRGGDSGGEEGEKGRGSGDSCRFVDEKCDDDGGDDLEGVREETRSEKGKDIERGGGGEYG